MRRKVPQSLREADIKAALIDRLLKSPEGRDDAVLISELPVYHSSRRADLVLANGKLHAFEIKSDVDRLDRLAGQIETFASMFEMVTVVTVPRFADRVAGSTPSQIGLLVAEARQSGPRFTEMRACKKLAFPLEAALCFLNVVDLQRLFRAHFDCPCPKYRSALESFAASLPISVVRGAARDAVKSRHRGAHELFCSVRDDITTTTDLTRLRRPFVRSPVSRQSPVQKNLHQNLDVLALSTDLLGPSYDGPMFVLRRQKSSSSSLSSEG